MYVMCKKIKLNRNKIKKKQLREKLTFKEGYKKKHQRARDKQKLRNTKAQLAPQLWKYQV